MKLTSQFHDNGNPGFTKKGRDLNRFRCELNAYRNLQSFGVCERGAVPRYYGYVELDRAKFQPHLSHFADDTHSPSAILLEYLPDTEELNCVNYSDDRLRTGDLRTKGDSSRSNSTSRYLSEEYPHCPWTSRESCLDRFRRCSNFSQ